MPAPGQGCLVLEARADDEDVAERPRRSPIADALTCLTAERALVQALDASCHTPIGAHAVTTDGALRLCAFVGLPDGSQWIRDELEGSTPRSPPRSVPPWASACSLPEPRELLARG